MHINEQKPNWLDRLTRNIKRCWVNHGPTTGNPSIQTSFDSESEEWQIVVAPVFQEVYGGNGDGKKVWTAFSFQVDRLMRTPGMVVEWITAATVCTHCTPEPMLAFKGKYRGHPIILEILLEPPAESPIMEILDTIRCQVRAK